VLVDSGCPPHGLGPAVLLHRGPGYLPHGQETGTSKAAWLGEVEAPDKARRDGGAAAEFKVLAADGVGAATMVPILI
jgi:hypothetical protein